MMPNMFGANSSFDFILYAFYLKVGIATFATFLYLSDDNRLDAKTLFVTLSLFDIIRDWTSWLPWLVMDLIRVQTNVSFDSYYLTRSMLGKHFSSRHVKIFFLLFPENRFHISSKSSPEEETICMNCQGLFFLEK